MTGRGEKHQRVWEKHTNTTHKHTHRKIDWATTWLRRWDRSVKCVKGQAEFSRPSERQVDAIGLESMWRKSGMGQREQGGGGGAEVSTGSLWRVENQQQVTPLGLKGQYHNCQHSLVCRHWAFSTYFPIYLGIQSLRCATIQGNSL